MSTFDICQIVRQGCAGHCRGCAEIDTGASPSSVDHGAVKSPTATDIPINCITRLFRFHLFGNV